MRYIMLALCYFMSSLGITDIIDRPASTTVLSSPNNNNLISDDEQLSTATTTGILAEQSPSHSPNLDILQKIIGPKFTIHSVERTQVASIYKIDIDNKVYYISQDGHYLFKGDLIDLRNQSNITEHERNLNHLSLLKTISSDDYIIYPANNNAGKSDQVTVFVDFDCPYCHILLNQAQDYQNLGIEMRIAFFPRGGLDSKSAQWAKNVWCAADRRAALLESVRDMPTSSESCDNPIEKFYNIARQLNISGTPTIILDDGDILPGFVSPTTLRDLLDSKTKTKNIILLHK